MAYTDFTLAHVKKTFSLNEQLAHLFENLTPLEYKTGENWQFMRLHNKDLFIDSKRYYIDNAGMILAIFQSVFDDSFHTIQH